MSDTVSQQTTQQQALQPSLLDRLTDYEPEEQAASRYKRVISEEQWYQLIRRDLTWLFNTSKLEAVVDLEAYPEVQCSVLNYGSEELTGSSMAAITTEALEQRLRETVLRYEPRLVPSSLTITVEFEGVGAGKHSVGFTIEGQLWAHPIPMHLYLKTEVDLDSGHVEID